MLKRKYANQGKGYTLHRGIIDIYPDEYDPANWYVNIGILGVYKYRLCPIESSEEGIVDSVVELLKNKQRIVNNMLEGIIC